VNSRKPTLLRWAEEAEAKQVCEWAGLEGASRRPDDDAGLSRGSRDRPSLLRRLRDWFATPTGQITRDDG